MGIPTLGFDEVVTRLGARWPRYLILGIVKSTASYHRFQLFLSRSASRMVACLDVSGQRARSARTTSD
ncbi:hypothetical protein [Streptosporangium sandarakinum]|uniref:hypothetical protein n=1 Tax=Streptosporangium sandarakinum TaxID=1260955 RepID=UPI00341D12A6